jgi:hypothetical protein
MELRLDTHCQYVFPFTRAEISSLAITGLLRTVSWMASALTVSNLLQRNVRF